MSRIRGDAGKVKLSKLDEAKSNRLRRLRTEIIHRIQ